MLKYMLDTNLCVRVLRSKPEPLREKFNAEGSSLSISSVVLYELLYGAAKSARPVENRGRDQQLVDHCGGYAESVGGGAV